MISTILTGFRAFPLKFRVLVAAMFIDRVGGTMLFPFFALYVTRRFNVGMTEAGLLLGMFGITGLFGNMIGGALADKFGRRRIVIFGLVSSASCTLIMGLADTLQAFYVLAAISGLLGSIAGPAHGAMVADLLPERQRSEGFGVMRVVGNLAWIIGPTIGGLLAARGYVLLFVADTIASTITAYIVYRLIPETRPEATPGRPPSSLVETVVGYKIVMKDGLYIAFLVASVMAGLVYQQMYSTLSVFLVRVHNLPDQNYGMLLSIDAFAVVIFQVWITNRSKRYPPMLMMALGTALYMVGFGMYGFVSGFPMFVLAILIITLGEMLVIPVSQALAAGFAPEDMRGRYMAFFGLSWGLPEMVGPAAAGLIMDNYNPLWVWYLGAMLALVATMAYLALHVATQARSAGQAQLDTQPG